MSEANLPVPNVESQSESQPVSCCAAAGRYRTAVLRAVVYVPALLLTSAFAAAAIFPDLAEYATPLIDIGVKSRHVTDFPSSSNPPCCQQLGLVSPCQGTVTEDLPADAMAAVNVTDLETASN